MMLRIPKGMTIQKYFERQRNKREAAKEKRKFLNREKPRKIQYSKTMLRDQLDALFNLWVKVRDKLKFGPNCRICCTRPGTVAYHLVPKCTTNWRVRWADENAVLGCAPCNEGERWHRQRYREKHVRLFGEGLIERIEKRGRGPDPMSIAELLELKSELRKKLAAPRRYLG